MPEFPRPNLNSAAQPWARRVQKLLTDQETELARLRGIIGSQGRVIAAAKQVTGADGSIYRPNGIVVPTLGSGLIYSTGVDSNGNPVTFVSGRQLATPWTIYFGEYEDDAAGSYSAMQVDPETILLRSNVVAHGGYSALLTLAGGNAGSESGDQGSGGGSNADPFAGYIQTPGRFAVEFGSSANNAVDYSGSNPFDPSSAHWAIRYLAGKGSVASGGQSTFLSLADGLLELGYLATEDGGDDATGYGFAFPGWLRASQTTDDNGDTVKTLALDPSVTLDGWGTSGGGGGSGGGSSLATAYKGTFGDEAVGPFARGDVVDFGDSLFIALHAVADDSTPPTIDTDNWIFFGVHNPPPAYSLATRIGNLEAWNGTDQYNYDALVTHNGYLWVAINQSTNVEPGVASNSSSRWREVAVYDASVGPGGGGGSVAQATHTVAGISRLASETEILADGTAADYDQITVTAHILKFWAANTDLSGLPSSATDGQYLRWDGTNNFWHAADGPGAGGTSGPIADAYTGDYATGLGAPYNESQLYAFVSGTVPASLNASGPVSEDLPGNHTNLGTPPADAGQTADPPQAGPYMLLLGPMAANNGASIHRSANFTGGTNGSSVGFDFATDVNNGGFVVYVDGVETYRFEQGATATPHQWDHTTVNVSAGNHDVSISAFTRGNAGTVYIDNLSFNNITVQDTVPGTYHRGQIVRYQGKWFLARVATTSSTPDPTGDTNDWLIIAELGGSTVPTADDTTAGIVRLATSQEASDGKDTSTAMTPAEVKAAVAAGAYTLLAGWKGTYDPTVTYNPGDLVRYNGALVLALDISTGSTPPIAEPDVADWAVIVAKPPAGGTGGGNGPLVVGPTNSLTMPGLWIETDNAGNFVQWWYDDHSGIGGSNTNGAVSFGPTNGLQQAGLWIQTDEDLVPQMLVYDDGNH